MTTFTIICLALANIIQAFTNQRMRKRNPRTSYDTLLDEHIQLQRDMNTLLVSHHRLVDKYEKQKHDLIMQSKGWKPVPRCNRQGKNVTP
jgi:hypothetical protein